MSSLRWSTQAQKMPTKWSLRLLQQAAINNRKKSRHYLLLIIVDFDTRVKSISMSQESTIWTMADNRERLSVKKMYQPPGTLSEHKTIYKLT